MRTLQKKSDSSFVRVGESLWRYQSSGTYFAYFWHHGKQIKQSLKTSDREEAKRKLSDLRKDMERMDPSSGSVTVAQLLKKYLSTVRHLAGGTQKKKEIVSARVTADWTAGPDQLVRDVKLSDVLTWLGIQKKRMGNGSYNDYVQFIRGVFKLAVSDRIIAQSPAAEVKQLKREKPLRLTPTWEEFQDVVEDIRSQQFNAAAEASADFVDFIGRSGLGLSEVAAIRRKHVDRKRGRITIFRNKTDTGFQIPIYPQLRALLEKLLEQAGHDPESPLLRIANAKKAIANACTRLKLPAYTHISFRRMFITKAIEKNVDVKVIAEWQGHRDGGKLILDTYSHVRGVHSAKMAQLMSNEPDDA